MRTGLRLALILLGALAALGIAEMSLRIFGDELPVRSEWPTVETQLKASQLTPEDEWDAVFLGSSVTEAAVDPRLLTGVTAYNGALPFSTPISHEVWYRGQFSGQQGRVVVLGLPAWPYHESVDGDRLVSGIESALRDDASAPRRLAMIDHRGVMADWFGLRSREVALQGQLWTLEGHLTAYYEISEMPPAGTFAPFGPPKMSDDVRSAITRLAEQVKLEGGTFVLMIEPAPFPEDVPNDVLQRYLGTLRDLAGELDVELWDTFSIGWADNLYADGLHFNRQGTEEFSALVNELIASVR